MSRKITKIKQHGRDAHRYDVYLNDEYAFSVHEDVLVDKRLLKGKQVNQADLQEILREEEKKKIEHAGLRLLSYRPRTTFEMRSYLQQKGFDQELIEEVVQKWINEGYLDDEAFAWQWIEERVKTKHKGRYLLRQELIEKGIEESVIQRALEQMDQEAEYEACFTLAKKRAKKYDSSDPKLRKYKLFTYLSRRGYPSHVIERVCKHLVDEEQEDC
ncbi:RecX family transcriptional regulator [Caldalkalibacillus thermarum TA2.A1]|uniref:Regulatory protein RecX n=1 Tax=Caldalkalibacillus thermarum (strain TA2.A1) TaxID=986075 RepID=A0A8X8I7H8_CALTT|nr:RecX family transcriptional regulator [Caldalkalibacillus thermarum]QZT32957.1 RecX family transcriptional regulator [Caldalkalibacillus thermarum TA2.A1]